MKGTKRATRQTGPKRTEPHALRAKVVKRTAGFVPPASPLLCGHRGDIPHRHKPLPAGSLAEQAVQSGRPEYAEQDGIAVVAKPVLWKGRVAKVAVAPCPDAIAPCSAPNSSPPTSRRAGAVR